LRFSILETTILRKVYKGIYTFMDISLSITHKKSNIYIGVEFAKQIDGILAKKNTRRCLAK